MSGSRSDIEHLDTDILVIGTGIAGLTFALRVAEHADVLVITKKARLDSNTNYAQGGIAAVMQRDDSFEQHVQDTLGAGAGLCHVDRVEILVRSGPEAVADLMDWGVRFSHEGGRLALGREGGHSRARIVHSQDKTGPAIEGALVEAVANHPRIRLLEDHTALSLQAECLAGHRRCRGAWVLDIESCRLVDIRARATLLAAGGSAAIYLHTTNPAIATGDGVALAHRVGATVANMEFIQFHPTALYPAREHAFLISEALRGEGATLRDGGGESFMTKYDSRGDLAPRDIVARAVQRELRQSGQPHVWLDATGIGAERFEERFPWILEGCEHAGIDPRTDPIPVVPAAHYVCGGVWTDAEGRTTLPGLYAAGECSCTGVHGANRLASNSLLEAVVFAERAANDVVRQLAFLPRPVPTASETPPDLSGIHPQRLELVRRELREAMWDHFGIVRAYDEMAAGSAKLEKLRRDWVKLRDEGQVCGDGHRWGQAAEVLNMLDVSVLVVRCALWRRESRGLHHVTDCPYRDNEAFLRDSFILGAD